MQEPPVSRFHVTDDTIDHLWSLAIRHTPKPRPRYQPKNPRRGGATLEQVSQELDSSPERVRQIEVAALEKCLAWCEDHRYRLRDLLG